MKIMNVDGDIEKSISFSHLPHYIGFKAWADTHGLNAHFNIF